jgi:8-oxo-dGTP diphosphatase
MLVHVSTIIRNSENKILFVREAKEIHRGKWNLPGGRLEENEHVRSAAIREVKEETILDVVLTDSVLVIDGISPKIHSLRFVFFAESYSGTAEAGDEILELRWMSHEELLALPDDELVGAPFLRAIIGELSEPRFMGLKDSWDVDCGSLRELRISH